MKKEGIIKKFKICETDTGSIEVQIALLTEEIEELVSHLKNHKKDIDAKRSLLKKVAQRKKFLEYLKRNNKKSYDKIKKILDSKK